MNNALLSKSKTSDYLLGRVPAIALWFLVLCLIIQVCLWGWNETREIYTRQLPVERWVEYDSVQFINRTLNGSLKMASTSAYHLELDEVVWVDNLWCNATPNLVAPRDLVFWSSQKVEASKFGPQPLTVGEWTYTGATPTKSVRACEMRSTLTIENSGVIKTKQVRSEPFVIRPVDPTRDG